MSLWLKSFAKKINTILNREVIQMISSLKIKKHLTKIFDRDLYGNPGFSDEQIVDLTSRLIELTTNFIENQSPSLRKKIDDYRQKTTLDPTNFTSRNEQWITVYGDSFYRTGEAPLKTLKYFLDKYPGSLITGVHILPCFETPDDPQKNDGGFAITNHEKINPNLGTWQDIRAIAANRLVMLDFVLNHVSTESIWFKEWLTGNPEYENFFIEIDDEYDPRLQLITRPRTTPLIYKYTRMNGIKAKLIHTFGPDQVDLNLRNPAVFLKIFEILFLYINNGAGKIRLDAIGYAIKILGTCCMNLPQVHEFIKLLRTILEIAAPHVRLVAEVVAGKEKVDQYFGDIQNPEVHEAYMFSPCYLIAKSLITGNAAELKTFISNNENNGRYLGTAQIHDGIQTLPGIGFSDIKTDFKNLTIMADNTLENGGKISFKSFNYNEIIDQKQGLTEEYFNRLNEIGKKKIFKITGKNRVKKIHIPYELNTTLMNLFSEQDARQPLKFQSMHAFLYSMRNIPMVYYNSFFGKRNDSLRYEMTQLNRDINRGRNEMEALEKMLNAVDSTERKIFDWFKALLKIRSAQAAFHPLADENPIEIKNEQVVGIVRTALNKQERLISLINVSSDVQMIAIHLSKSSNKFKILFTTTLPDLKKLKNGEQETINTNIKLKPYQCIWLKEEVL